MPLEPRVDGEAPSSGVHGGHVLHILDLLQNELLAVIPVSVVQMLHVYVHVRIYPVNHICTYMCL